MQSVLKAAAIAASILAPIACGGGGTVASTGTGASTGSTTGTTGTAGSGTGTTTGTTATGTTTTGTTSSGACSLPDGSGKAYTGFIELGLGANAAAPTQFAALGEFTPTPSKSPSACTGTMVGACCYQPPATATAPSFQSAGALKITDGTKTLDTLMFPAYGASSATVPALTWASGDTLDVTAAGATVDAFSIKVVAPALLTAITPAFGVTPIDVSLSADLVVKWMPSAEACSQVTFGLSQLPATPALPYIGCVADDSAGTLTVPASLLGKLTAKTGTATIERVEAAGVLVTNAGIKLVVIDGHYASVAFKP